MDDVRRHVVVEHVGGGHEAERSRWDRPERDRDAIPPVPRGRHRRPADVPELPDSPTDPRRCVRATRDPGPAVTADPNPAAVVEGDVAPVVVARPVPVVLCGQRPVSRGLVGREIGADDRAVRHPNGAIGRVLDPLTVGRERLLEVVEGAGVRVGELVSGRVARRRSRLRLSRRGLWFLLRLPDQPTVVVPSSGGQHGQRFIGRVALRQRGVGVGVRRPRAEHRSQGDGATCRQPEEPSTDAESRRFRLASRALNAAHRLHDGSFLGRLPMVSAWGVDRRRLASADASCKPRSHGLVGRWRRAPHRIHRAERDGHSRRPAGPPDRGGTSPERWGASALAIPRHGGMHSMHNPFAIGAVRV